MRGAGPDECSAHIRCECASDGLRAEHDSHGDRISTLSRYDSTPSDPKIHQGYVEEFEDKD